MILLLISGRGQPWLQFPVCLYNILRFELRKTSDERCDAVSY